MDTVRVARQSETRVRATGAWHAFSNLFPDESTVLVDLSNYGLNDDDRMFLTYAVSKIKKKSYVKK